MKHGPLIGIEQQTNTSYTVDFAIWHHTLVLMDSRAHLAGIIVRNVVKVYLSQGILLHWSYATLELSPSYKVQPVDNIYKHIHNTSI